jgi:hypothetical protein
MSDSNQTPADLLAKIQSEAPRVASEYAAHEAAIAAERDVEAAILTQAIEAARPALRAIAQRIVTSERTYWPTSATTASDEQYHDVRGVCVSDGVPGPLRDHPRANRGAYQGTDLFVLVDGSLLELAYSGQWSRWQGEGSSWETTARVLTPREAMDGYDLATVLGYLADKLARQARVAQTAKARDRAERLEAVVKLAR